MILPVHALLAKVVQHHLLHGLVDGQLLAGDQGLLRDEEVQDLLKGDNLRLDIVEHPVRGYEPDGCSYNGPYQDVRQLKDVFVRGNGARSTGQRDFGPESKFSTTVFAIDLTSFLTDPGSKSRKTFKARIIFAELPGTESLAGDVASLAQRQGANLNKSLLQIKHVARVSSLSSLIIILSTLALVK